MGDYSTLGGKPIIWNTVMNFADNVWSEAHQSQRQTESLHLDGVSKEAKFKESKPSSTWNNILKCPN